MNQSADILVVGGGIVGLSAALAMQQKGFEVIVVDKQSRFSTAVKRVYAINPASVHLLKLLQVWQTLKPEQLSPYQDMYVWDQLTQASLDFNARTIGKSELGFILEEQDLKRALITQCKLQGVSVLSDTEITHIEEHSNITIAHSTQQISFSANFLLITDGVNSKIRQQLNVPVTAWPYHQRALVATIKTEKAHHQTAYQVFTKEGTLAFLPLTDSHTCSIVWSTSFAKAIALANLPIIDFNTTLAEAFENKLGQCELLSVRHCFELKMQHVQQYVGSRWALMGDAAHTIHPLAGLGLNLGLADVKTWMDGLAIHQKFSPQMLGAYQRARKYEVWQMIGLMEGLKFVFTHPLPPIHALRKFGMKTINHFMPLKRFIIGYAASI